MTATAGAQQWSCRPPAWWSTNLWCSSQTAATRPPGSPATTACSRFRPARRLSRSSTTGALSFGRRKVVDCNRIYEGDGTPASRGQPWYWSRPSCCCSSWPADQPTLLATLQQAPVERTLADRLNVGAPDSCHLRQLQSPAACKLPRRIQPLVTHTNASPSFAAAGRGSRARRWWQTGSRPRERHG